mmetsp:Transcript_777/g.1836  ORF Transcript_777/g.1836 Transcript_777/m.1836 type:complete len:167 (-) Transcript_777:3904-4404(-)
MTQRPTQQTIQLRKLPQQHAPPTTSAHCRELDSVTQKTRSNRCIAVRRVVSDSVGLFVSHVPKSAMMDMMSAELVMGLGTVIAVFYLIASVWKAKTTLPFQRSKSGIITSLHFISDVFKSRLFVSSTKTTHSTQHTDLIPCICLLFLLLQYPSLLFDAMTLSSCRC